MNEATLNKISEFMNGLGELFSRISGIGFWLFVIGFTLLIILVVAILVRILVSIVKIIPNLTIGQFIKLIVVLAVVLIIAGLFFP